ncbi:MAG TPA: nucleoid occlusion protein [Syntrophomonadaceae bacterium]|nr:nucleoid occlusion protein [Syntrophomonadaceae bacterium]
MVRNKIGKMLGKKKEIKVSLISLDDIFRSPYQPRRVFNEEDLRELAYSIKNYGVIQPIIVRQFENKFQLVAGERRFRACKMLGLKEIPAIVQDINDEKAAAISVIENLQRKELNYFEEASAYSQLLNFFGMTQEEIAVRVGKSQSAIANKLRLLKLPEEVRDKISPDIISERHARALLKLNTTEMQMEILKQIYEKDLTVKQTENLVLKTSQNNIPLDDKKGESGQNFSMIIRDARIFLNTIRETVKRAKQTGVDIVILENDSEDEHEVIIKIAKRRRQMLGQNIGINSVPLHG